MHIESTCNQNTRMWANAQRDGRPAEYRWRQASVQRRKVWLTPTTTVPCSNAAKTRNPLKFAGVPQTRQQISAVIVCRSSPQYEDVWRRYRYLTSFFRLQIHALAAKIQPDKVVRWCQNGDFLRPVFSASCVEHISDMHSKFALRPHDVWKYGRHPISNRWNQARKKDRRQNIEITGQKI